MITLPLFPVVNWLKLNDTHLILILLYATFFVSLGTIVMRTFIDQIPRELDEAAMIDGASQFQIIARVIFPLAAQGMLAVAVFVIVYAWNEFLFAFIFTTTKAKTAPLVVAEMIGVALNQLSQRSVILRRQGQDVEGPPGGEGPDGWGLPPLFDNHVNVGSTEAEAADARTPGLAIRRPRPDFGWNDERKIFTVEIGIE